MLNVRYKLNSVHIYQVILWLLSFLIEFCAIKCSVKVYFVFDY